MALENQTDAYPVGDILSPEITLNYLSAGFSENTRH